MSQPKHASQRDQLLHHLHVHCRGAGQAMTGAALTDALNLEAREASYPWRFSERVVRKLVGEVRAERDPRHLVGSSTEAPFGYYIIESVVEWERVSAQLWSRVNEQRGTASDMEATAAAKFGGRQMEFRFREAS